jgi:hypothetical protein
MFVPVTEAQPVKSVDVASAANSFVLFNGIFSLCL